MPNTHYMSQPLTDWSSEISAPRPASSTALQYPAASMPADAPPALQFPASSGAAASPTGASGPSAPAVPAVTGAAAAPAVPAVRHPAHNEFAGSTGDLRLQHNQPFEIIESPTSTNEAFLGSLKAMLLQNRGNFVAATLLIGTQGTMVWEGILHEVGNDYFIIYQTGRQRYILCDIYALKYMEFYDTKQRELCEHLLQENGEKGFC